MSTYNVKVKYYNSGEIQLHIHPNSVVYDTSSSVSGSRSFDYDSKTAGENKDNSLLSSSIVRASPVDRSTSNFARSIRRTKNTVFDFALNNTWDFFVTFTFDKENFDRYDYDTLNKYMRSYLNHFKTRSCNDLKYLGLPEFHKDGAIHYHFLMSSPTLINNLLPHTDQKHYPGSYYLPGWKSNNIFEPVKDSVAVSCYMCKYVVKDLIVAAGKARYIRSRNLSKPDEETFFFFDQELEGLDLASFTLKQFEDEYDVISCVDGTGNSNYFRLTPKKKTDPA